MALRRRAFLRRKKAIRRERAKEKVAARREWRQLVLDRAGHVCERCGEGWPLEAHHILPRGRGGKDWDFNGACLCSPCHARVHEMREGHEDYLARNVEGARAIRARLDRRLMQ